MTQLQKKSTAVLDGVIKRVSQLQELGELKLPKDYAAENAARGAWLILQEQTTRDNKRVLDVATQHSIANAMFDMLIQGLSVTKKQGDFILYGNKLKFQREYHGNKALAKRFGGVAEVSHNTVYEKDEFEYIIKPDGRKEITKHEQKMQNIDMDKIVGAYAVVKFNDGTTDAEVMTMKQIRQSWMQGATKGQSPAHKNFPDMMAEKTVANRLLTSIINASDDAAIFGNEYNQEKQSLPESEKKDEKEEPVSFDMYEDVSDDEQQEQEQPEQDPEPTPEPEKKESKPKTPKKEEKPAEQPEMDFDDEPKEPF